MKKLVLRFIFMFSVYFLIINVCFAQSVQLSNAFELILNEEADENYELDEDEIITLVLLIKKVEMLITMEWLYGRERIDCN